MEQVPNILDSFGLSILDLLNSGKSLLVKNILLLIKQMFTNGQAINVEKAVYIFLPVLIKKASTDIGSMKLLAQEVLIVFSQNCGYECSLVSNFLFSQLLLGLLRIRIPLLLNLALSCWMSSCRILGRLLCNSLKIRLIAL